jgi:hypothetical protein
VTAAARSAWTFLALGENRQFAGNDGYNDKLAHEYAFDSTVANHGRVSVGDLAIVRDAAGAIGMGWIEALNQRAAYKQRRRCPVCETTALKRRVEKRPRYRCNRGHESDSPIEETIEVVAYAAHYGSTWWPLRGHLDAADLAGLYFANAQQHAIRALSIEGLQAALEKRAFALPSRWWQEWPAAESGA